MRIDRGKQVVSWLVFIARALNTVNILTEKWEHLHLLFESRKFYPYQHRLSLHSTSCLHKRFSLHATTNYNFGIAEFDLIIRTEAEIDHTANRQ